MYIINGTVSTPPEFSIDFQWRLGVPITIGIQLRHSISTIRDSDRDVIGIHLFQVLLLNKV